MQLDYPIIQAQIRYILDRAFKEIVEKIRNQNVINQSEWQTFTTTHIMTQLKFLKPDIQNDIIEDCEQKPISQENFLAYKICLNEKIQSSQRMTPSINQFRKRQVKLQESTFYNWNKEYHYSLIEMPQPEVQISQVDEDLRRMKMQQISDTQKMREFSQQQLKEKRKEKEKYYRLKQLLNGKQYTYDYNCEPIINKSSQINQEIVPQIQFEVIKDKNPLKKKTKIQKPEIQQQTIKRRSKDPQNSQNSVEGESKSFFNPLEDENYDRQTSNIPFIKLSKGVKIREENQELAYFDSQPQITDNMRITSESKFPQPQTRRTSFNQISSKEIPMKVSKQQIKTERNGQILCCDIDEYFCFQKVSPEKIPTTQRPLQLAVVDDYIYKQDVLKLPRVRSRSIHTMNRKNRQILIHSREQVQSFHQPLV